MCAATALPVRFPKASLHTTTPVVPVLVKVALKVPLARATFPYGFGRSWLARSVVLTLAVIATWSRISPAGLVGVWTFT